MKKNLGLGLWCLKILFQQYFSYIMAVSFIGGGNRSTEKTNDLSQVTDDIYHIMLYSVHLAKSKIRTLNLQVVVNPTTIQS